MIRFDLEDQAGLEPIARELTLSEGFLPDAVFVAARDEKGEILAVMVMQEWLGDVVTVHWGAAKPVRRTLVPAFKDFVFRNTGIRRIWTTIHADNQAMLIFALKSGWRVVGFSAGSETGDEDAIALVMDRESAPWLPPAEGASTHEP